MNFAIWKYEKQQYEKLTYRNSIDSVRATFIHTIVNHNIFNMNYSRKF